VQDGITYGDEYFAELDYIENCEKHKEDYESDVNEPDSPRSRSVTPDDDEEEEKEKRPDGDASATKKWKTTISPRATRSSAGRWRTR
jgi:hypothetical protein